jgi:hypothetical protein
LIAILYALILAILLLVPPSHAMSVTTLVDTAEILMAETIVSCAIQRQSLFKIPQLLLPQIHLHNLQTFKLANVLMELSLMIRNSATLATRDVLYV